MKKMTYEEVKIKREYLQELFGIGIINLFSGGEYEGKKYEPEIQLDGHFKLSAIKTILDTMNELKEEE